MITNNIIKVLVLISLLSTMLTVFNYILHKVSLDKDVKSIYSLYSRFYTEIHNNPMHRIGVISNESTYSSCFRAHNGYLVDSSPRILNNYQIFKCIIENYTKFNISPDAINNFHSMAKKSNTSVTEVFMLYCNYISKDNDKVLFVFSDPYGSIKVHTTKMTISKAKKYLNRINVVSIRFEAGNICTLDSIQESIFTYDKLVSLKEFRKIGGLLYDE